MTSSNWRYDHLIVKTPGGECFGVVTVLRPIDSSSISLTIINHKGELVDLIYTTTNQAEYETLMEFGTEELEVVKESVANNGMNYEVLVRKRKRTECVT